MDKILNCVFKCPIRSGDMFSSRDAALFLYFLFFSTVSTVQQNGWKYTVISDHLCRQGWTVTPLELGFLKMNDRNSWRKRMRVWCWCCYTSVLGSQIKRYFILWFTTSQSPDSCLITFESKFMAFFLQCNSLISLHFSHKCLCLCLVNTNVSP